MPRYFNESFPEPAPKPAQPSLFQITRKEWIRSVAKTRNLTYAEVCSIERTGDVITGASNCQGVPLWAAVNAGLLPQDTDLNMPVEKAIALLKDKCNEVDLLLDIPQRGDLYLFNFEAGPHIAIVTNYFPGTWMIPEIWHCSSRAGKVVREEMPRAWTRYRRGVYSLKDFID